MFRKQSMYGPNGMQALSTFTWFTCNQDLWASFGVFYCSIVITIAVVPDKNQKKSDVVVWLLNGGNQYMIYPLALFVQYEHYI